MIAEGELVARPEFHARINGTPAAKGLGCRLCRVEIGETFHMIRAPKLDSAFRSLGAAWTAAKGRAYPTQELRALLGLLCVDDEVRDNLKQSVDEDDLMRRSGEMNFRVDREDSLPLLALLRSDRVAWRHAGH